MMATIRPNTQPPAATQRNPRPFWRKHFFKLTLLPLGAIVALWFLVLQPRTTKTVDEALPTSAPAPTPAPTTTRVPATTTITAAQPAATTAPAPTTAPSALPIIGSAPTTAPTTASLPAAPPQGAAPAASGPVAVKSGAFAPSAQKGAGKATIFKQTDGKYLLRLEDFEVANGPDLRVRLLGANGAALDLGGLKGNKGNQNYDLPADFDPAKWNAADVWCRSFREQFIKAALA